MKKKPNKKDYYDEAYSKSELNSLQESKSFLPELTKEEKINEIHYYTKCLWEKSIDQKPIQSQTLNDAQKERVIMIFLYYSCFLGEKITYKEIMSIYEERHGENISYNSIRKTKQRLVDEFDNMGFTLDEIPDLENPKKPKSFQLNKKLDCSKCHTKVAHV